MARKGQTVTRYSHNPLAKKFKCPQCGNWFRTLQVLSGHIRFKHGVYEKQDDIVDKLIKVERQKLILAARGRGLGLSTSTIKARQQILNKWAGLLEYCEMLLSRENVRVQCSAILSVELQRYHRSNSHRRRL